MKITTTPKPLTGAPASHVRVVCTDTAQTILEREGKTTTLRLKTGKFSEIDRRAFMTLCRLIIRTAREQKCTKIALHIDTSQFPKLTVTDTRELYSIIAQNFIIANYEFTTYKTGKREYDLAEVLLCGAPKDAVAGIAHGTIIGECVNECRDLANTTGGDMTPEVLANAAKRLIKGTTISLKVLDEKAIKKEGMGAILGVAKGSDEKPRFIIMEYRGAKNKKEKPLVFIGKGITFDTGGLNLKPGDGMLEMHMDMSGGAAVLSAIVCAARLTLKKNIVALIPAAENSLGSASFRPGDVLTSLSGKTIDVLNTDAEGRLVLADALTYAKRYEPTLVIDVATLTGAAVVALGEHASALMTQDDELRARLLTLAEASGDYLWPLPLWSEYKQYTKGLNGDIANVPWQGNARAGGAINGGMFLSHFADGYRWAHIDMAPRMKAAPGDRLAKGATGEPVRLLVKIAEADNF